MNDQAAEHRVLEHIQQLVQQEHDLMEQASLPDTDHQRLSRIQVELDQCWDLLRQRRALRETGSDPDRAHVRPGSVVEKYVG